MAGMNSGKVLALIFLFCCSGLAQSANTQSNMPAEPQTTHVAPVLPDSTKVVILHSEKAIYPFEASINKIQGEVVVKFLVSEDGDVLSAEVVSGNEVLRKAAIKAAKKFKFQPFIRDGKAVKFTTKLNFDFAFTSLSKTLTDKDADKEMAKREAKPLKELASTDSPKRIRVAQGVAQGRLIRMVTPVYPDSAMQKRIVGRVILQAVIGKDGRIKDLRIVSGPSELAQPVFDAVQMWEYRPYLLEGEPVEVETQITVNYQLGR